jgi:hypothetical protein
MPKASTVKKALELSYKNDKTAPDGYSLDKSLSTKRAKVYKANDSNEVIVAHRGSASVGDWRDNISYATTGNVKNTETYKKAKKVQNQAIKKYGADNITSVGHSRAGLYVQELNDRPETRTKNAITLNKAVSPYDLMRKNKGNQIDIRSKSDLVSALDPLQRSKNKTITIGDTSFNPLAAHSVDNLDSLGDRMIGSGFATGGFYFIH